VKWTDNRSYTFHHLPLDAREEATGVFLRSLSQETYRFELGNSVDKSRTPGG